MTAYFSNGSEWDAWNAAWCETCIHDAAGPEDGCPIILQLLLGEPTEHVGQGPGWSPQTVAWCSQYEKRPKWQAEVVGDVVGGGLLVKVVGTEYAEPALCEQFRPWLDYITGGPRCRCQLPKGHAGAHECHSHHMPWDAACTCHEWATDACPTCLDGGAE